jgi:anti-sigma regulatory factor (Ser/Thr protein kinase)
MNDEVRIPITSDSDMVPARAEARALATRLGFTRTDATLIATAVSEIARNIVVHVGNGEIVMKPLYEERRHGLLVEARDNGPGIRDVEQAIQGRPSHGGLGLGLPGARNLMDEFTVDSRPDHGTTVMMKKWRIRDELERLRERRATGS